MSSLQSVLLYFTIVVVIIVSDVYCGDGTVSVNGQATPTPPDNNNPWQKLSNQNPVNPLWGNPNQQTTTTPWPALGARRPVNQNQASAASSGNNQNIASNAQTINSNANRNIGIDLSYGLNPGQNTNQNLANRFTSNNRNVGVDLSYGLNAGGTQNLPRGNQNAVFGASHNQQNRVQTPGAGSYSQSVGVNKPSSQNPAAGVDGVNQRNPPQGTDQNKVQTPGAGLYSQSVGGINKPSSQNPAAGVDGVNQRNPPPGQITGTDQNQKNVEPGTKKLSEDDELREFSETLLKKDVNNAAKYVTINFQGETTSRSATDEAPKPLLNIKSEAFDIPTIARMMLLHNNYILETNVNEHVTPQEKIEENNFLDAVLSTSVMQHARNFLIQKGKISKDPKDFRDKLKEMWFNMYSRGGGKIGSSGFEHVFLAELKGNDVSGLHNWLYFNEAESKKQANYLGYMKKIEFGNKGAIVKYHFLLDGKDKPVGSMFIGTSPEFELALYSTCFMLRANKICPLRLGGKNFIIRTFTFRYRGKNMIGSAFPEI